jgi:hypothetical protein
MLNDRDRRAKFNPAVLELDASRSANDSFAASLRLRSGLAAGLDQFEGDNVKRIQNVNIPTAVNYYDVVLAEGDEFRMRNLVLTPIRGSEDKRAKAPRQMLSDFFHIHVLRLLSSMFGVNL